jgi:hypothetical protein
MDITDKILLEENLNNHLNSEQLPLTFIAFHENQSIGMCSLPIHICIANFSASLIQATALLCLKMRSSWMEALAVIRDLCGIGFPYYASLIRATIV